MVFHCCAVQILQLRRVFISSIVFPLRFFWLSDSRCVWQLISGARLLTSTAKVGVLTLQLDLLHTVNLTYFSLLGCALLRLVGLRPLPPSFADCQLCQLRHFLSSTSTCLSLCLSILTVQKKQQSLSTVPLLQFVILSELCEVYF